MVCVLGGTAIGLLYLDKYRKETTPPMEGEVELELVDVPAWVNSELKQKALTAARGNLEVLRIDENAAGLVQQNIDRRFAWLDDVKVQTTHNALLIEGRWRKPMGLIKSGKRSFYVDAEQVVLDFVQMPGIPIVEITGLSAARNIPPLGEILEGEDLAAAITLLDQLERRDRIETTQKPLLSEIKRLDVSNFDGRKNRKLPHIVLYAQDDTPIIWGAKVGEWQRHLESTDEQKIAKLYSYYKEYGTLSGGVKHINLCDPLDDIPQPIDKY
ncbi:MAG: cell division protein FtsQ/DivIB [Planctomycetota bacterium]